MDAKIPVTQEQLKDNPKKIGKTKNGVVYHMLTKGGLNIIMGKMTSGSRVLGCANHIAIARFLARKIDPDIVFDELSKSEDLPVEVFSHLVPFWEQYTQNVDLKLNA